MESQYTDYVPSTIKKTKFTNRNAFYYTYTAVTAEGVPIKGYVVLTYVKKDKNRYYVLHFMAPEDRFENFAKIRKTIVNSVKA